MVSNRRKEEEALQLEAANQVTDFQGDVRTGGSIKALWQRWDIKVYQGGQDQAWALLSYRVRKGFVKHFNFLETVARWCP